MSGETILEIKGLSKSFGKKEILKDINLTVNGGEVFGFLGPNGAGKTTLMKVLFGLEEKTKGAVYISGKEVITNLDLSKEILKTLGKEEY